MPGPKKQGRCQQAVLWEYHSDGNDGTPRVSSPVGMMVRWESAKSGMTSPKDDNVAITATVIVDRKVAIGSVFWLGSMATLPTSPTELMRVVDYKEVPDLKGRSFHKTAMLAYLGDTLPTVVTS